MIGLINYGVGNLGSVRNMLKKAGFESILVSTVDDLDSISKIILPGVGAFDHCIEQFNKSGLREKVTQKVLEERIPLLGICVGLQMLMESSEEGDKPGLSWVGGHTIRFRKDELNGLKIPHMGWSEVRKTAESALTTDMDSGARFYFVHSYHVKLQNSSHQLLSANYGYEFTAAIQKENIYGVQFHPEKSHKYGMAILKNFALL